MTVMEFIYKKNSDLTLAKALSLEWLETNGLGGYASSTIINCHTRKYHGLLVSKVDCIPDKYLLLSRIEDVLISPSGKEYFLTAHQYPDFFQDGSFSYFREFSLSPHPCFVYDFEDITLTKEILMINEEDTILIKYKISGNKENIDKYSIKLRPLIACRNFHVLSKENSDVKKQTLDVVNGFAFSAYDKLPVLFFQ
jgi:predicted glycogen debranching enzyme